MICIQQTVRRGLKLLQNNFNVGLPSENFCLLRCLDILSPAMLVQCKRSRIELAIKKVSFALLMTFAAGLTYDLSQQRDIRIAMDIFCILMQFWSILSRCACLRNYLPHINAMQRVDENPHFQVGVPWADGIRRQSVKDNNRYLGLTVMAHAIASTVYVWQNMTVDGSFVQLITYSPIDWSKISPMLDKSAQLFHCLLAYVWAWHYGAGQLTIIVLMRITIAEYRVFLQSLATLDEQIVDRLHDPNPRNSNEENVVRDLLNEHARQHQNLLLLTARMRTILRVYTLLHFTFYLIVVASLTTRMFVITGSSSLGMAMPVLVAVIYFYETFGLCMLSETIIQLNCQVSRNLYNFDWPRYLVYGRSVKHVMLLMMMQANNTRDFSAGGLTTVSAELFGKTCQFIYTLIMCMANLTN